MNWLVAHAYVVVIAIVAFSIVATSAVVYERNSEPTAGTVGNWGRTGGLNLFNVGQPTQSIERVENISESLEPNADYTYIPIQTSFIPEETSFSNDWNSLLTQLIQEPSEQNTEPAETSGAYSFIPSGLISTEEPTEQKTALQTALFEYGNRVGSYIRAFDDAHKNMLTTLRDAYADRGNVAKRTAAEQIGLDYQKLGEELEALEPIPIAVKKTHQAIARSYKEAGAKMILKLRATSDDEFLAAMHAYNNTALEFTNNFVALATYLSGAGVKFSTSDAGSVFTFSPM